MSFFRSNRAHFLALTICGATEICVHVAIAQTTTPSSNRIAIGGTYGNSMSILGQSLTGNGTNLLTTGDIGTNGLVVGNQMGAGKVIGQIAQYGNIYTGGGVITSQQASGRTVSDSTTTGNVTSGGQLYNFQEAAGKYVKNSFVTYSVAGESSVVSTQLGVGKKVVNTGAAGTIDDSEVTLNQIGIGSHVTNVGTSGDVQNGSTLRITQSAQPYSAYSATGTPMALQGLNFGN